MNLYKNIFKGVIIIAVLFGLSKLPLSDYLNNLVAWFESFGIWAPVMFFAFFALTSSWMFPVFMLSITAGILFGTYQGFLIISMGNLASCLIMFLIARYKGREWFEKKISKYKTLSGLNRAIESEGWKMLFMLRAVPIVHMILLNITCGLSKVRLKDYLLGTWLGMLPMLLVYAYMGSLTDSVIASPQGMKFSGNQNIIFIVLGIGVLIFFSVYMKRVMKKYIVPVTV